jgi:hypothetical protein
MELVQTSPIEFSIRRRNGAFSVTATCSLCGLTTKTDGYTSLKADEVLATRMDNYVCDGHKANQRGKSVKTSCSHDTSIPLQDMTWQGPQSVRYCQDCGALGRIDYSRGTGKNQVWIWSCPQRKHNQGNQ